MKNNTRFLLSLPLLCSIFVGCGDHEAELRQIREQQNERQIVQDPRTTQGRCLGDQDKPLMYGANLAFAHDVKDCVEIGLGTADLNTGRLKERRPQMTDGCIDCFAQLTKCTANNCKLACMFDSASAACEYCSIESCHAQMFECSGIPTKDIPTLHPGLNEANTTLELNHDAL